MADDPARIVITPTAVATDPFAIAVRTGAK